MGLQILIAKTQALRAKYPIWSVSGWSLGALLCLEEFLQLLALQGLLQPFKEALLTLAAMGDELITALNLLVSTMQVAIQVANTFISTFSALINDIQNFGVKFPFSNPNFISCPPVKAIEEYLLFLPKYLRNQAKSLLQKLPGGAGTLMKKLNQLPQTIKYYEYKVLVLTKQVKMLQLQIQKLQAFLEMIAAVVEAIDKQFPPGSGPTFIS